MSEHDVSSSDMTYNDVTYIIDVPDGTPLVQTFRESVLGKHCHSPRLEATLLTEPHDPAIADMQMMARDM